MTAPQESTSHEAVNDDGGALGSAWEDESVTSAAGPDQPDQIDPVDRVDPVDQADQVDQEGGADGDDAGDAEMVFPDVMAFVEEFFAPVFGRDLEAAGTTWCPEWWRHAEAVYRLEALWRAWEHLRQDASLGPAIWLRDHLDHQLAVLLSVGGPLRGCSVRRGHQGRDYTLPTRNPYGDAPEPPVRREAGEHAVTMPLVRDEGGTR